MSVSFAQRMFTCLASYQLTGICSSKFEINTTVGDGGQLDVFKSNARSQSQNNSGFESNIKHRISFVAIVECAGEKLNINSNDGLTHVFFFKKKLTITCGIGFCFILMYVYFWVCLKFSLFALRFVFRYIKLCVRFNRGHTTIF